VRAGFAQHAEPAQPSAPVSGHAAPSDSAPVRPTALEIRVRDRVVFIVRAPRAGRTAAERARAANTAIEALLAHPDQLGDVRFEEAQGTAVIYVGKTPIFTLGPEDVEATGEASLNVLAAQVTTRMSDAIAGERKRSAVATTVFSFSLLIFSALIAFLLLGRASDVARRVRVWMTDNPERVTGLRLGKIELLSPGAARGALTIALTLGYRFIQIAIAYAWLIFGLSLFESTRGYTEKLTGMAVTPLYALATRIGGALPFAILGAVALIAVSVLVRFVGLFFDSVARGDTRIEWLSRDLARPTSALVRFGIIVVSLLVASPLITGESDGALARVGLVALVAVALASTPVLASAVVGIMVVYGRRLKKGELVEFGGRAGKVSDITLLEVRMEDAAATEISIPHLLGLFHPTRIHRHPPLASVDVVVDPSAPQADVEKALLEAARRISSRGRVELIYLDDSGAHWRVVSATHRGDTTLGRSVQDALTGLGVGLGRGRGSSSRGTAPAKPAKEEGDEDEST
jgi:small-conductance mechanosensitive channel